MEENTVIDSELVDKFKYSFREMDNIIDEELLSWLNSYEALNPSVKKQILQRLVGLRTKFQVMMVEVQKKIFRTFFIDLESEEMSREYLRSQIPYMSNKERLDTLRGLSSVNEDRLSRLETQLTGFDFLNTTAMSLETLSEVRASEAIVDEVKKLSPERRARLLLTANEIIKEINATERADGTTEI